jgi:23S rRNA pseudouridine1911/1915/1917 synthase
VVVDKPAGVVVHPARGHWSGTLVSGLLARGGFEAAPADARDPEGALRPGIVHRIDKLTSGILVVAKDEATREGLKAQLAAHSVERAYLALTEGVPVGGRIATFYGRHPRVRQKFTSLAREGRRAVTHVEVVERLAAGRAALVRCRLETGRTHQIRVHLSHQGHPVFGDPEYGGRRGPLLKLPPAARARAALLLSELDHQALHAETIAFAHPVTGAPLEFTRPVPPDFAAVLHALECGS